MKKLYLMLNDNIKYIQYNNNEIKYITSRVIQTLLKYI